MQKSSLTALAEHTLAEAGRSAAGRSAHTVFGGHEKTLRQTLIALTAGTEMAEHANPGEATLHVLRGRVRLTAGEDGWDGTPGDLIIIPDERHALAARTDAVVLLTVVKLG